MKRVDSKLSHLNIFLGDGCGRNFNSISDIKWSWKLKLNEFPKNSNFTLEVILRKRFLQLDFCPFLGLSVEFKQSNSKSLSSKRLFWAVRPLWKVSTTFLDHRWECHWDREGQPFSKLIRAQRALGKTRQIWLFSEKWQKMNLPSGWIVTVGRLWG